MTKMINQSPHSGKSGKRKIVTRSDCNRSELLHPAGGMPLSTERHCLKTNIGSMKTFDFFKRDALLYP